MEILLRKSVSRGEIKDIAQRKIQAIVPMTTHISKKAKEKATAAKGRLIEAEGEDILRAHRQTTELSQLLETERKERKEREDRKAENVTDPPLSAGK